MTHEAQLSRSQIATGLGNYNVQSQLSTEQPKTTRGDKLNDTQPKPPRMTFDSMGNCGMEAENLGIADLGPMSELVMHMAERDRPSRVPEPKPMTVSLRFFPRLCLPKALLATLSLETASAFLLLGNFGP